MKRKQKLELNFTILGNPATKKNSSNIFRNRNGKPFVSTSSSYKKYFKTFQTQIEEMDLMNKNISQPCNIKCLFFMQTRRKVDLTNLLSAAMDCLVSCGIIEDDNCVIAVSNDGSRVYYDKENPRVEISITETERTFIG